ncbi:MAG: hypothetical protein LLG01_13110 [Planctomycetaceae bacterium]|nr:hypothetical protein [Planctomycetaceae bacterium]
MLEISNERIKVQFHIDGGKIVQRYFANAGREWVLAAESFSPPRDFPNGGAQLYNSRIDPVHRLVVTEGISHVEILPEDPGGAAQRAEQVEDPAGAPPLMRARLSGMIGLHRITQTITLGDDADYAHVEVVVDLGGGERPPRLDCVVLPITAAIDGAPDYSHAPAYKPTVDDVIGDRVFFAPAAIVQKGAVLVAIVPDLDIINANVVFARGARQHPDTNSFPVAVDPEKVTLPAAMDLELQSGLTSRPLLAYGLMDSITRQHVYWQRDNRPGAMVRELSSGQLRFGFDLFVAADAPPHRGYQAIARHHWKRYGRANLHRPRPQAMPWDQYARQCYAATWSYQGYRIIGSQGLEHPVDPAQPERNLWQQWDSGGKSLGAVRLTAPQWYDLAAFTGWWNNACDATGMHWWGKRLGDETLADKARRIVTLAVSAPQKSGMFPSLYHLKEHRWVGTLWRPPSENYDPAKTANYWDFNSSVYQTASASVTCGYLMQYRRTCEESPAILPFVRAYGDFLLSAVRDNGCVPAWFDENLAPPPSLRNSNADGGAHVWVLCELFAATGEQKYLDAARKMAGYLMREVLPGQKWSDFEALYSCAVKAEAFFDVHTGQPPRNLMSISWAMQGLPAIFEATRDRAYLEAAEAVADYASLFQAVWAPHYVITAYPFGGFNSQVGDAEWLDQRTHRMADPLVRIGLLTGRGDLVERGVAAVRGAMTLTSHERHRANGIYMHTDFPTGMGPENIDHEGFPQRPLSSGASWSSVGGLAAAAHAMARLGGVYVDVTKPLAVGVDGVAAEGMSFDGRTLRVKLVNQLAALPSPWTAPLEIGLRVVGLADEKQYELIVNAQPPRRLSGRELAQVRVRL